MVFSLQLKPKQKSGVPFKGIAPLPVVIVDVVFERKWKLKRQIIYFGLLLTLFNAGCSNSSSTNAPVSPTDPAPTVPVNPADPTPNDPYGADIRASVPIDLANKTQFSGLSDIAGTGGLPGNIYLPLVGDAKVRLQTTSSRSQSIHGNLFLAFEDQQGFWGARWENEFPGTGIQVSTSTGQTLDIIFADDDLVVRIQGVVASQTFFGGIYYRLRQPSDTACRQVSVGCTVTYPWGTYTFPPNQCPSYTQPDLVTPCRNYMSPSNTQVKRLGNFTNTFSNIATLPEAQ